MADVLIIESGDGTEIRMYKKESNKVVLYMDDDFHNKCSQELSKHDAQMIIDHLKEQFNL